MSQFYLSKLKTKEDLKELLAERWNYDLVPSLPLSIVLKRETREKVLEEEVVAEFKQFKVVFCRLNESKRTKHQRIDQFFRSAEREIISQFPREQRTTKLFVFSSKNGDWWHFVNADQIGGRLKLKRFTIEPENRGRLRTASEQLDKIKIDPAKDDTLQKIRVKHEQAFSIEALTDKFFGEYIEVFERLKEYLFRQKPDIDDALENAHHYTHLLLNRLMFLYFVQKRGCFGGDKNFLHTFWNAYRDNFEGKDEFFEKWLKILFSEALNHKFHPRDYFKLPKQYPDFNSILQTTPYLNGGLFRRNELDSIDYRIEDKYFVNIFDFFEGYNFTVRESTPLDQDLSVDPEMLGNVYEMLVNVSEAEDERHKAGIFYTPRVEIELMIRRSLVEFLFNKTGIEKKKLYEFIFKEKDEQRTPKFSREERDELLRELDEIKLVDPACGSGHYLVVVTQILYELKETLYKQKGVLLDKFDEKKKIIENSIFGVDVMEWATEIAKLRLWLDLFVDADKEKFESLEPLLPSLSFKIRVGDSLLQEIGGIYFSPSAVHGLPASTRGMLVQLKDLKRRFYNNDQFVSENQVKGRELEFYRAILDEKIKQNQAEIVRLEYPLVQIFQQKLIKIRKGEEDFEQAKLPLQDQKKIDKLKKENELLEKQKNKLSLKSKFAFWPIEFAEVFAEKGGFDIVIANPPYVRQEIISDPTERITDKKEYKEKLGRQLQEDWNDPQGNLIDIPKRSDLYVYFYLKGLKLLNPDGIFCYISSNSWLDVGYGAKLQEILLRRVPIFAIYDNQAKRSFKHADVNTVIVVLGAPTGKDWQDDLKDNKVKFVMFKKPFEEVISAETFLKIESLTKREETKLFKVFPIKQSELYEAGMEYGEEKGEKEIGGGEYTGNKWGGKYLRAPEIYWKILEKGKGKLVRLGDIAEIRRGFTTGANDFFYLPSRYFDLKEEENYYWLIPKQEGLPKDIKIEKEFLKPVAKSPRECKSILIKPEDLKHKVFMCHKTKEELKNTYALKYIKWGEKQGFHKRPTCRNKKYWWRLDQGSMSKFIFKKGYGNVFIQNLNLNEYFIDQTFYTWRCKNSKFWAIYLNSTIFVLFLELSTSVGLGGGLLRPTTDEIENIIIPLIDVTLIESQFDEFIKFLRRAINSIFTELDFDPSQPIRQQEPNPLPDRKALDDIVFDALGLTEEERKEIYWAVAELVKNRLEKAKSV